MNFVTSRFPIAASSSLVNNVQKLEHEQLEKLHAVSGGPCLAEQRRKKRKLAPFILPCSFVPLSASLGSLSQLYVGICLSGVRSLVSLSSPLLSFCASHRNWRSNKSTPQRRQRKQRRRLLLPRRHSRQLSPGEGAAHQGPCMLWEAWPLESWACMCWAPSDSKVLVISLHPRLCL